MTIDSQIQQALIEAEIAIMKQDLLRELNMRSAEIKASLDHRGRVMSEGTRRKLFALVVRKL